MALSALIHNTNITKILLDQKIQNGSVVVDATMGNGKDTLFLCQRVLPKGKVYAFDIQEVALKNTLKLLKKHHFDPDKSSNILCIKDSHENFDQYITEPVDVFMYNLGYIPGGDQSIITSPETTIKSLNSAFSLLKEGGMISIIVYYGHPGGSKEKQELEKFLQVLSNQRYKIFQGTMPYNDHCPPIIYIIEKLQRKETIKLFKGGF